MLARAPRLALPCQAPSRAPRRAALLGAALVGLVAAPGVGAQDAPGPDPAATARPGDWEAPLPIPAAPFVHAGTTAGRRSRVRAYSARPETSEAGPEVVYRLEAPAPARVTAWVEGDGGAVDVDVHLLAGLEVDAAGLATRCLARADRTAEAEVPAGPCWVVVDTFEGPGRAGPYRLRVDLEPLVGWYERPVARGVALRTRRDAGPAGAPQRVAALVVDPRAEGVSVRPLAARGCQRVSALGRAAGAVAAINAGFFGPDCRSVSFLKVDGRLLATSAADRTALGFDAQGRPRLALVPGGRDWPEVTCGVGGVGRLLERGAPAVVPGAEGAAPSFATARHPRTAVGLAPSGALVLVTVDGRTAAGPGMSLAELAGCLAALGCDEGLNLDGGGSTTLWVAGEPWGGVVNEPSDGGRVDHAGERGVGSALAVWAPPLDRDPVWLVAPPPAVDARAAGELWLAAADPEGAPLAWRVEPDPTRGTTGGATVEDRGDGTARLCWPALAAGEPSELPLRLSLSTPDGRPTPRRVHLRRR